MNKKLKIVIDIAMTASMPALMAYERIGAALHEYLGAAFFMLLIAHHILNFGWSKRIVKGRYHAVRITGLLVNLLLFAVMLLLPISGLMMTKHLLPFLHFGAAIGSARVVHLLASHWGFLLMSFHLGMHWNTVYSAIKKKKPTIARLFHILPYLTAAAVMGYGIYAFLHRELARILFLKTQFVFYDFSEPMFFFLLDYSAMMAAAAGIGYFFTLLIRKISQSKTTKRRTL